MSAEPWESRECFFAKLGLNEKRRAHRRIFRQMLREAVVGRTIVLHSNSVVAPSLAAADISEDMVVPDQVLYDAMRGIYDAASSQSKAIYDLVTDQYGYCWVLRWTLRWALNTRCETCLDELRKTSPSSSTHSTTADSDRVDSASPGEHTSAHKRKSPSSGSEHSFGSPVKRQKVEQETVPFLLTRGMTDPLSQSLKEQQWAAMRNGTRQHAGPGSVVTHQVAQGVGKRSHESSPRTPMSLSSMLNPSDIFPE